MEGNGRAIYNKGIEKGETDKILRILKQYLDHHYSFNQAAQALFLSEEEQNKYRALLNLN